jgi:hypothetical protein
MKGGFVAQSRAEKRATQRRIGRFGLRVALALSLLIILAASASAGTFTLHPSGFGEHSYAAWKAMEGQPDSTGNKDQALYFQKDTPTPTFAAGVAVFKGFSGLPASSITGLQWDHRIDGHCGAGAPRWNVGLNLVGGGTTTVFLGCAAAAHAPVLGEPDWIRDTQPAAAALAAFPGATIRSLAIVYDEGDDFGFPCPDPGNSCVFLDNITVEVNGVAHTWTSASDNGNGGTTTANTTLTADELVDALGAPLTSLFPPDSPVLP